jgi:Sec7-like guanine-nucleotide exchange factor
MYKNNKEFNKWKKTEGLKEKNHIKAMEGIELTEEQLKDAKSLQHSTFKTFNKVDESSQKYSESVEALGQSIQYPLTSILAAVGILLGGKHLTSMVGAKSSKDMLPAMSKYISIIFLTLLPNIGINAYLTKEQKKASRVADMLAINELQDYRHFADFSKYRK